MEDIYMSDHKNKKEPEVVETSGSVTSSSEKRLRTSNLMSSQSTPIQAVSATPMQVSAQPTQIPVSNDEDSTIVSMSNYAQKRLIQGISVIPAKTDKSPALKSWKKYQSEKMSLELAGAIFETAECMALVCGEISGNLECLDFDKPDLFEPFMKALNIMDEGLASKLIYLQTPSSGYHIPYRCINPVEGSQKLAVSLDNKTWIETRGEGGYFLTYPSPNYSFIKADFDSMPTLTSKERSTLLSLAHSFTEKVECHSKSKPGGTGKNRPGDIYNEQVTPEVWQDLLFGSGWKFAGKGPREEIYLTRPGKESGVSASWKDGMLYVFSTNAGIPPGPHSAFSVYTHLKHNGDYSAAAKEISLTMPKNHVPGQIRVNPEDWPEPLPIIGEREAELYPIEVLPDIVKDAVKEVQSFVQAPLPLVAASALSTTSLAVQAHVDVKRAEGLTGPTSLNMLTIAESGERKSACDKLFTEPFKLFHQEQQKFYSEKLAEYSADKITWGAKHRSLVEKIESLANAGESTVDEEADLRELEKAKPAEPVVAQMVRGDETPENLIYSLAHDYPSAGIMSSEAAVVFGGHGMKSESQMNYMAMLNCLWSGEEYSVGRKTSGSFTVRDARLTVGLQTQEAPLRAFFSKSDNMARGLGFLARFLVSWPESTQGNRPFKQAPKGTPSLKSFQHRILEILKQSPAMHESGKGLAPTMLCLSEEAFQVWVEFHDYVEMQLGGTGMYSNMKDVASKAAENVARLAALFHVVSGNGFDKEIDAHQLKSAGKLMLWYLNEADRFIEKIALTGDQKSVVMLDEWLLKYYQEKGTTKIPVREIQQNGPKSLRKKDKHEPVVKALIKLDRLQLIMDGRKKMVELNPKLFNTSSDVTVQ
ncbi:DUF3987 domain-containing protein [Desulfosediminicola ganghwensis]|uniref:DUF3987 domain-containing protein n=1 Tax=Desulfosediminicola ganghwensis TaxID=2569540 RepID=UPI0010AD9D83|nr:DUF3987 domain-containing protein [Desulfosediminicola ganghwensis]